MQTLKSFYLKTGVVWQVFSLKRSAGDFDGRFGFRLFFSKNGRLIQRLSRKNRDGVKNIDFCRAEYIYLRIFRLSDFYYFTLPEESFVKSLPANKQPAHLFTARHKTRTYTRRCKMNNYHQRKKMKGFVVRFSIACSLVALTIGIFAYLKDDAPAASARIKSPAASSLNVPVADDMPILFIRSLDIFKISENGATEQRLTQTPEAESSARWSPNGQKIAYVKSVAGGIFQIWLMNADGSNQTLISEPDVRSSQPNWSPNGQKILYVRFWRFRRFARSI